mgnify:CR=1 FL=1
MATRMGLGGNMQVGDIFRYKVGLAIHTDVDGMIGVVLSMPNRVGQYKTQVGHKILWLTREMMEVICK